MYNTLYIPLSFDGRVQGKSNKSNYRNCLWEAPLQSYITPEILGTFFRDGLTGSTGGKWAPYTKIPVIEPMLEKLDELIIGRGLAIAFMKDLGRSIDGSLAK